MNIEDRSTASSGPTPRGPRDPVRTPGRPDSMSVATRSGRWQDAPRHLNRDPRKEGPVHTTNSAPSRATAVALPPVRRAARLSLQIVLGIGASLIAFALRANAQSAPAPKTSAAFEIRPYVGAYLPTGDQRDLLKDAVLVGGQASYRLIPQLS